MKRFFTVAVVLICFSWVSSYAQITLLPNPGNTTSLVLNWSGSSTQMIVVRGVNSTWTPTNGNTYTAATGYPTNSTTQGSTGPDWDATANIAAVVYNSSGGSVTVTNLASSNFYTVLVYTVSGTNYTLDESTNPAITLWFVANTSTTADVNSTYLVPSNITSVVAQAWGGGGGGGGGTTGSATNMGSGGGGGGYSQGTVSVTGGSSVSYNVGAAGKQGLTSTAPANGGNTWFSSNTTLFAEGGTHGLSANASGAFGGNGGASANGHASGAGAATYSGGKGGTTGGGNASGGGSSAGVSSDGNNGGDGGGSAGTGGAAPTGGAAGGDGNGGGDGSPGYFPGGAGGGGDNSTKNGGNGGGGLLIVSYVQPPLTGAVTFTNTSNVAYSNSSFNSGTVVRIRVTLSEQINDSPVLKVALSGVATLSATNMVKSSTASYYYDYTVGSGNGSVSISLSNATSTAYGFAITSTPTTGSTFTIDNAAPTASAPTNTAQRLKDGATSSSTVQSTETGTVYLILHGESATSVAALATAVSNSKAFSVAVTANTATTVAIPLPGTPLVDGVYDIVAVDQAGNVSSVVSGWLTIDNTPPTVSSFIPSSTPVYGNSVGYTLTFDNKINTLTSADFTLGGTASSGTAFGTINSSDGGTTWTIPINSITSSGTITLQLNANTVTDLAGNSGPSSNAAASSAITVVIDPTNPTAVTLSLTQVNPSPQIAVAISGGTANRYLVVMRMGDNNFSGFSPVDGTIYTGVSSDFSSATDQGGGNKIVGLVTGASFPLTITGLSASTNYYVEVYAENDISGATPNYASTSVLSNKINTAPSQELTIASSGTAPQYISSLQNSLSGSPQSSFSFTVADAGADGIDGGITQLVINSGINNSIDWTQAVASAQLSDGTNTSTVTSSNVASPSSGQYSITFPSLSTTSGQIGDVSDGGSKIYTLTIALNSALGSLASSIDSTQFEFNVSTSSVTTSSVSSSVVASQSVSSGQNHNLVSVKATQIKIVTQPSASAIVNVALVTQPKFIAADANGNTDINFNYSLTTSTSNTSNLGATSAPASFSNGVADFAGSGYKFLNVGTSTMKVTADGKSSVNTNSIAVTSTTTIGTTTATFATSPLINSTTGKAVFGFSLQTDGANLNLTNLTIAVNTTDAILPLKNFKLYSGAQPDGSDATDLSLTASTSTTAITFSSISIPLTSTAKYFFLLADVNDYFYSTASTIKFSLTNSGVSLSLTGASVTGSSTGTQYALKDNTSPQILSIANSVSLIYSGALTQTVKVVYNEPMNNATTPTITFSNGMTNWGAQAVGSWSTTTLTNDTYTTTFTHNSTSESDAAVTSSVTASVGAKDFGGNYFSSTATSAASFVLDNTPPTVSSVAFSSAAVTTNAENLTVTIKYSKTMNTSVSPSIVFSASNSNFTVSTAGAWSTTTSTNDTYKITYTHNTTSETVNNITIAVSGAKDTDGNPQTNLSSSASSFNIDTQRPVVSSINLNTPTTSPTNATSLTYQVVFNESVSNVDATDFVATKVSGPTTATTGAITVVAVSATTYNVTVASVNTSSGNSQFRLDLSSTPTVTDTDGNTLTQAYASGQVYLVDQIVPQASSIAISSPTVSWSTVNGTSAASISWLVTFSENVTGVNAADFSLNRVAGTDLTFTTPVVVTGSGSSYTVTLNGVSLLAASSTAQLYINLLNDGTIVDQASNALAAGLNSSTTGNEYYTILFPTPSNAATNFSVTSQTTTDIAVQWSNPVSPAVPANFYYFQIKKNTVPSFPNLQSGVYAPDPDNDFSDGTLGGYFNSTSTSSDVLSSYIGALTTGLALTSGFNYDIRITSLNYSGPYGSPLQYQLDYLTSPVLTGTANTTVASTGSLAVTSSPVIVSSLANTQASAVNVLKFTVTDDGSTPAVDNAPFKFNNLVINQGSTNNVSNWTTAIAGAILSDGTNTISGTVNSGNITFASIPSTHTTDEGYIADDGAKIYTLSVWLKTTVSASSVLNFKVNNSSFTYDNSTDAAQASQASSQLTAGQSVESGSNTIGVVATKLVYNIQPPSQIGVASVFPTAIAPVVYAEDANGNLDSHYSGTATITNTNSLSQNISSQNFVSGVLTLNTLSFTSAGATKITVSAPTVTSITSSATVTVGVSTLTKITLGTAAPNSFSSLTTALSGAVVPQQNAVQNFEFIIADDAGADNVNFTDNDGLPTQISQIKITRGTNNDGTYFNDWTKVIAGAQLTETNGGTSVTGTVVADGLVFNLTQNSSLSLINDNGSNTYRLKIWLLNPVGSTTIANNIDKKYFDFSVANTSVTVFTTANTSSKFQSSSADAGAGKNQVLVTASKLSFVTQPNATQYYDASISPSPTAQAQDANGNLDTDYNTAATVATDNTTTYPLANAAVTPNNGNFSFQSTLDITSAGNGLYGGTASLVLSSGTLTNGTSNSFTLEYSANSDVIKDPSFSYTSDIPYANYQSTTFSSNASGVALEQFLIRDGGAAHSDADGSPTVLSAIKLNISNYQFLRTVALYKGTTKIAELPVTTTNVANIVGNTADMAFTSLAPFQAAKNSDATLTVYATFMGTGVIDQQVVEVKVTSVTAGTVGSSFGSGTSTAFPTLATGENRINVVATQLAFSQVDNTGNFYVPYSTSNFPTNASIFTPFSPVLGVEALDANNNLDLDFNGTITAFSIANSLTTNLSPVNSTFGSGTYKFSPNFEYTSGDNQDGSLTMTAGGISGISPNILLRSSFESFITLDPTFQPNETADYISYLDSTKIGTDETASYELIRALLVDGSRSSTYTYNGKTIDAVSTNNDTKADGDIDGAATTLDSLSFRIYSAASLSRIALFDSAGHLLSAPINVTNKNISRKPDANKNDTSSYVFTFKNIGLKANDDSQAPLSIRATFRKDNLHVRDHDVLKMKLMAASVLNGSQFFNRDVVGYIAGQDHHADVPDTLTQIDVIATKLVFTNSPPAFAGINQPVPYPVGQSSAPANQKNAVVQARDGNELLDIDFTTANNTQAKVTSPAMTSSIYFTFDNGVAVLDSLRLMYSSVGVGTLTVSADSLPSSVTAANLTNAISGLVNVINVKATIPAASYNIYPSTTISSTGVKGASIKGGLKNQRIFGVTFTPDNVRSSEPSITSFTFRFDAPYKTATATIFENFKVLEAGSVDVVTSRGATLIYSSSTGISSNLDLITVKFKTPQPLYSGTTLNPLTYILQANVDVTANSGTNKITPYFEDDGYSSTSDPSVIKKYDTSTVLTYGSASAYSGSRTPSRLDGNQYSFASTKPPELLADQGQGTSPYNGQLNVSAAIDTIAMRFDVEVTSLDGIAYLRERSSNKVVANLIASDSSSFVKTNNHLKVVNPLKFGIKMVTGDTSLVDIDTVTGDTTLIADNVYYVTVAQGTFNALSGKGTGIADNGWNFYGGISSNSVLYFKVASNKQPVLDTVTSTAINTSVGTLSTTFDQHGTSYFLILKSGAAKPTVAEVKDSTQYALNHPLDIIAARGSYYINSILKSQTYTFPAKYVNNQMYDIYVYAENDAPIPVGGNTVYYHKTDSSYTTGRGTTNDGKVGPTAQITIAPVTYKNPDFVICPDSYVTITDPIVIGETSASQFSSPAVQDFNILLPTGYQFDLGTKPTVRLIGKDFGTDTATVSFVNNSLANIAYSNSGNTSTDYIVISDMKIYGATGSTGGNIRRFYGDNTLSPSTATLATISVSATSILTFSNSFSEETTFPAVPDSLIQIPAVVTAIPSNYVDTDTTITIANSIRLLPQISASATHDYNASTFSGSGVTNDLLTLTAVQTGTAFDITMLHTDVNGCAIQTSAQYLVYDYHAPISTKLGTGSGTTQSFTTTKFTAGTTKAIINTNFPYNTASAIKSDTVYYNEVPGYQLGYIIAGLPVSQTSSQKMKGSNWASQVAKILSYKNIDTDLGTYRNYVIDYSFILNADTLGNPLSGPTLDSSPYDWFKTYPSSNSGNTYWTGGSLGKVEFTGVYQSTADQTVVQPFIQDVELFVPAVPLIEVASSNRVNYDTTDQATNANGKTPVQFTNAIVYKNGYQGVPIFCEAGGKITFNGYPQATSGSSVGNFAIYDYHSFNADSTTKNVKLIDTATAFVDNRNGTATLDPSKLANGYNDIVIAYTYQDNASPAIGTGYLVFRITSTPVATFTMASVTGGSNPSSNVQSFCIGDTINFAPKATTDTLTYAWNFNDNNSSGSSNTSTIKNPKHTFSKSNTYTIALTLTSSWGCKSQAITADTTYVTQGAVFVNGSSTQISVGEIPVTDFSVVNSCAGESTRFDASGSTLASGNASIYSYYWNYNTAKTTAPLDTTIFAPNARAIHIYDRNSPDIYTVQLQVTSSLGCQSSTTQKVSQLPQSSAFDEYFDTSDGKWQTLDLSENSTGTSWVWGAVSNSFVKDPTKMWSTTANNGSYIASEKSALYSPCLRLDSVVRPMISYDLYADVANGDGLVLQYSTDSLNIFDKKKIWKVIGTDSTGTSPGIDWYNSNVLSSSIPGNAYNATGTAFNSSNLGWTGTKQHLQPKHALDVIGKKQNVILRFAFSGSAQSINPQLITGIAIDSVRFGSRTRTVLFENFTTTNAGNNTVLGDSVGSDDGYINKFVASTIGQTQLVNVNYHIGFLGEDPFNTDNAADQSARALYYNVNKVPYAFLDGVHPSQFTTGQSYLFQNWGENYYDLNTLQLARADFRDTVASHFANNKPDSTKVTLENDGSLQINVHVTPLVDLPANSTLLQIAVMEKSVANTDLTSAQQKLITTGETQFNYVFKKMIPNAAGTRITKTLKADSSYSFPTFKWIPDKLYSDTLAVVVFLQNEATKEVYQAELFDTIYVRSSVVTEVVPTSNNVNIYPVPTDQELRIELPSAALKELPIRMTNEVGVFTEFGQFSEGEQNKTISTQGLSEGVYVLMIGNTVRRKVIIVHK